MESTEKVFITGINVRLDSIEYKTIRVPEEEELNFSASQKQEISSMENDNFDMLVSRRIVFEPNQFFELEVSVVMKFDYDREKTMKNFRNLEELKKYVMDKPEVFVNRTLVGASLSLLIGQITSTFGRIPVITPPNVITEEDN